MSEFKKDEFSEEKIGEEKIITADNEDVVMLVCEETVKDEGKRFKQNNEFSVSHCPGIDVQRLAWASLPVDILSREEIYQMFYKKAKQAREDRLGLLRKMNDVSINKRKAINEIKAK